jgi:hypothetical protein
MSDVGPVQSPRRSLVSGRLGAEDSMDCRLRGLLISGKRPVEFLEQTHRPPRECASCLSDRIYPIRINQCETGWFCLLASVSSIGPALKNLVSIADATGGCAQDMRAICFHSVRDTDCNRIDGTTARLDAHGARSRQSRAPRHCASIPDKDSVAQHRRADRSRNPRGRQRELIGVASQVARRRSPGRI